MPLRCTNVVVDDETIVSVSGAVDLSSAATLRDHLLRTIIAAPATTITVDLAELTSLDDIGVGILLGAAGTARQRAGDLRLVCTDERIREYLHVTGADRAVDVAERF